MTELVPYVVIVAEQDALGSRLHRRVVHSTCGRQAEATAMSEVAREGAGNTCVCVIDRWADTDAIVRSALEQARMEAVS